MARRQTECFRNLDDSLKLFGFLTLKSSGLVLIVFGLAHLLEMLTGAFTWMFGVWSFLVGELGLCALCAVVLSWMERQEDEHFVPSAIRYVLTAPWRTLYSGGRDVHAPRSAVEETLRAR